MIDTLDTKTPSTFIHSTKIMKYIIINLSWFETIKSLTVHFFDQTLKHTSN